MDVSGLARYHPLQMNTPDYIWDNLVLPDATLEKLKFVAGAWRNWETLQGERSSPSNGLSRGLLTYGRPGTGTTRAARTLAQESGCPVLDPGRAFKPGYIGQAQRPMRELFERARERAPCIIMLDAIDYLTPPRSSNYANAFTNEVVCEFLAQIEGVSMREPRGVFILGTAYALAAVDVAVVARFETIEIPFPGLEERGRLFRQALTAWEIPLDADLEKMIGELAACTDGINGRGIEFMAEAGQQAWARAMELREEPAAPIREEMLRKLPSAKHFSC
jgi:AAA+ superfamily predicted ATPase